MGVKTQNNQSRGRRIQSSDRRQYFGKRICIDMKQNVTSLHEVCSELQHPPDVDGYLTCLLATRSSLVTFALHCTVRHNTTSNPRAPHGLVSAASSSIYLYFLITNNILNIYLTRPKKSAMTYMV